MAINHHPAPTSRQRRTLYVATRRRERRRRSAIRGIKALTVLLLLVASLAFLVFGPGARLLGLESRVVISGSMEPSIPRGAAVLIEPDVAMSDLKVGTVALIDKPGHDHQVLHRIVAVEHTEAGPRYVTRGDANRDNDPGSIAVEQIAGTATFHLPWIGHLVVLTRSREGAALMLALPALGIILMELRFWYRYIRYGRAAFEATSGRSDTADDSTATDVRPRRASPKVATG